MLFSFGFDSRVAVWNLSGRGGLVTSKFIDFDIDDCVWVSADSTQSQSRQLISCGENNIHLLLLDPFKGQLHLKPFDLKKVKRKFLKLHQIRGSRLVLCGNYSGDVLLLDLEFGKFLIKEVRAYSDISQAMHHMVNTYPVVPDTPKVTHILCFPVPQALLRKGTRADGLTKALQSQVTPPTRKPNRPPEENYLSRQSEQWLRSGDYLKYQTMNDQVFDSLYSQNDNFNIITGDLKQAKKRVPGQVNTANKVGPENVAGLPLVCFSNGKVHVFDTKSLKLSPLPILDFSHEILNILVTRDRLIVHTANGLLHRLNLADLTWVERVHVHTSSLACSFRISRVAQLTQDHREKNNFSTGNEAFFLRKRISDKILTDKNIQTFSINHQFDQPNQAGQHKFSDSLDHLAINMQQIRKKKQLLLKRKFTFLEFLDKTRFDPDCDLIVTLDQKGKALFWQVDPHKKMRNVGYYELTLRDRRGIGTATGFQNVLMVGFRTGQVAVYYLGLDAPCYEFLAMDAPVRDLQIKEVRRRLE